MRLCPACSKPMQARPVYETEVDGCERCGGIWFDHRELTKLAKTDLAVLGRLDREFRPAGDGSAGPISSRRCPVCAVALEPQELRHAPGVTVDVCPRCYGIWADDTELTSIEGLVGGPRGAAQE
ncbi:MAG: zf-TFIIB domain-containing protein [Armatimonadota bacterium]